jgi:hypothetical protein
MRNEPRTRIKSTSGFLDSAVSSGSSSPTFSHANNFDYPSASSQGIHEFKDVGKEAGSGSHSDHVGISVSGSSSSSSSSSSASSSGPTAVKELRILYLSDTPFSQISINFVIGVVMLLIALISIIFCLVFGGVAGQHYFGRLT